MRVLFTTWSAPSHLYPLIPMAWACRAAGHEVRFAGMPSAVPGMLQAGLTATAVGSDAELTGMSSSGKLAAWHKQEPWPDDWPERPDKLVPEQVELLAALGRKQCVIAERMVDDLVAVVERWRPDLIVSDVSTFAGPVAGAVAGIPVVGQLWGSPGVLRYENRALGEEPLPEYAALFARFGLDAPVAPAALLDPCPPSMNLGSVLPRLPMRFVPYNSPGEAPAWADEPAGRPGSASPGASPRPRCSAPRCWSRCTTSCPPWPASAPNRWSRWPRRSAHCCPHCRRAPASSSPCRCTC